MEYTSQLTVKIFADGADKKGMLEMYQNPWISGLTTNPTLMHKAGVKNYKDFALDILKMIKDKPISFEVFADDFNEMKTQAMEIASWSDNVYVKIPVMNTEGKSSIKLIRDLAQEGVKQNITALMTLNQVKEVTNGLANGPSAYISVFAGRIADTGRDPVPMMREALDVMRPYPQLELIWASPRELLNIFQANEIGCQIITVTNDVLKKLSMVGKDLMDFSLETVKMFHQDALAAKFSLEFLQEREEVLA
jgi:transaldolase